MCSFLSLIILIIVTIYIALMYENAAIMLLVYVQAAFFVVSFLWLIFHKFALKAKVELPIGISEIGKENMVRIMVENMSIFPMNRVKVRVIVTDTLSRKKKRYWMKLAEVYRGENEFVQSIIFPAAGNYEIAVKKLRVYDMTGCVYVTIPVMSSDRVYVMPNMYDVSAKLTGATRNFYGEADVYDEHRPGKDNNELFHVREYQKGDRLQNVHWKMTAKQDEIMVKEHSLPKSCPVVFLLDVNSPIHGKKDTIAFIEAAVSISYSMMDAACPHYVVWYDSSEQDIVRARVDDEESLFYLLGSLMKVKWEQSKVDIRERYREKYRQEPYMWLLSLNQTLVLKKGDEIQTQLDSKDLEGSLSRVELLL